ncbi:hypothetical protein C0992_003964 [Termitomyces sp. T32_za158]|nr:hypothetical protein C0992_003964 [Termitomyces sp. T32_za158]
MQPLNLNPQTTKVMRGISSIRLQSARRHTSLPSANPSSASPRARVLSSLLYLANLPQTIQQMHHDHVPALPSTLDLLASTPMSPIQDFVRFPPSSPRTFANIHIFSMQGHPEFTESIVSHLVAAHAQSGIVPTSRQTTTHGETGQTTAWVSWAGQYGVFSA